MNASREYRQADAGTGSPLRVVVLLYEQLIKDLRGALAALERGDIEVRTNEIDHALLVAGQLQVRLDMKSGGEVASNLQRYYDLFRAGLLQAQFRSSPEPLRKLLNTALD